MTAPAEPPFTAEAAAYLADCARLGALLSPRYHPTEDGAVKFIPHRHHHDREADQAAEEQVRAAYRAAVAAPGENPEPAEPPEPSQFRPVKTGSGRRAYHDGTR